MADWAALLRPVEEEAALGMSPILYGELPLFSSHGWFMHVFSYS
jgi:hypothetical protein